MKTIVFPGKGGAGKTTTASNLGVVARARGLRVGLVDADPQGSLRDWRHARGTADLPLRCCGATEWQDVLALARRAKLDLLLVDMPPTFGAQTLPVIGAAHLVLLPMRPTVFDLGVTRKWAGILKSTGRPFCVVINGAPARRLGEDAPMVRDARNALRSIGVPLWRGQITHRHLIPCSAISGRGVVEADPAGPAAAEYFALWQAIERNTDTTRRINYGSSTHAA